MTTNDEIDHKLLNRFLGRVLDDYKTGVIDISTAINRIAHLVAALALPKGEGANPTNYMQAVLALKEIPHRQFRN